MNRWVLTLFGNETKGYANQVGDKVRQFLKDKEVFALEIPEKKALEKDIEAAAKAVEASEKILASEESKPFGELSEEASAKLLKDMESPVGVDADPLEDEPKDELTKEEKAELEAEKLAKDLDEFNRFYVHEGMQPSKSAGTIDFYVPDHLAPELIATVNVQSKMSKLGLDRKTRRMYGF